VTGAARTAASPGLDTLLRAAAERYRALGRVGGSVRLTELSAPEARAIAHLGVTGRRLPHAGDCVDVDLSRLDAALAGVGGLLAVLRAGGHELSTRAERRATARAELDAAWGAASAAADDERVAAWIADLRGSRGGGPPDALPIAVRALALLGERRTWDRARLASEAAGDPHALDDEKPAAALLLAALAFRDGAEVPVGAPDRRALLARHGILVDPLSSTVLVCGLRVTGTGPAAALLRAADGGHVVLTLAHVASSELRRSTTDLFTCEGVVVVRAADGVGGAPLICTDGQPSTACDALLRRLAPEDAAIRHSGDFDWGGLRIAALMRRRYGALTWHHDAAAYDRALQRAVDRPPTLDPPRGRPLAEFEELWARLDEQRVPIWQEDIVDLLVEDLRRGSASASGRDRPGPLDSLATPWRRWKRDLAL
jgi:uncharacterized protein (TIGR02679 family)